MSFVKKSTSKFTPRTTSTLKTQAGISSSYSITEQIKAITQELISLYQKEPPPEFPIDLLQYSRFFDLYSKILCDLIDNPLKMTKISQAFFEEFNALNFAMLNRFFGRQFKTDSPKDDRRFTDPLWIEDPRYEYLKESYYILTKYSLKWLNTLKETFDKKTLEQLHFYVKNYLDFLSPSNFLLTNPMLLKTTLESGGENLLKGYRNFLLDLVNNKGRLNISKTDFTAFKLGKNIAVTPGKVIYQNDLMQLIQYQPNTDTVYKTPILFIPPWINKYYILDLSKENSMVRWLVEQGFTVYMISWVNPDSKLSNKEFADYMKEGPLDALNMICSTLNTQFVHMVGYCIGGTLLGATLAYMKKMKDNRAASATCFMTLLDFKNPGELGVFIDETQIKILEKLMKSKGYLDGRILDMTFNLLRPNDLIWPYFINNYLEGKSAKPFDLLYWNADSTNLPQKMYRFYLHNMYLKNRLIKQGGIKLLDVPINLKLINTPLFLVASETDHITLWKAVYAGTQLTDGLVKFVLSGSGHVRGVINPPANKKYNYYVNERYGTKEKFPKNPERWLAKAKEYKGSWWPYWIQWLLSVDPEKGEKLPGASRDPEHLGIKILEDAPGSYVLKKL